MGRGGYALLGAAVIWSLGRRALGVEGAAPSRAAAVQLWTQLSVLNNDPYLQVADTALGLISVFDDLRYDRADLDMLSPPMRNRARAKLQPLGFRQVSGTVFEARDANVRVIMPKSHALGASPFDITLYTPKRETDLYLLTPTQTACQFVDGYPRDEAVARIKTLIEKHPINLDRLGDYLEKKPQHAAFLPAIGHLKFHQREAVAKEPLCRRRALG